MAHQKTSVHKNVPLANQFQWVPIKKPAGASNEPVVGLPEKVVTCSQCGMTFKGRTGKARRTKHIKRHHQG